MKFKTLSNREIRMDILPAKYPVRTREQSKSAGQFMLGRAIQAIYGTEALLLEEFPIPEERLFLDFYLPHHKLAFEFQGGQHDTFNKFFHGDKKGFEKSQERDARKKEWCVVNEILLVEVREAVTQDELMAIIEAARLPDV